MSKHTPGPWRVQIDYSCNGNLTHKWPIIIADGYEVVGIEGFYGDTNTDIANAHLIAAAPDLLEALEFVIRGVPDTWEGVQKARSAIFKATGEKI